MCTHAYAQTDAHVGKTRGKNFAYAVIAAHDFPREFPNSASVAATVQRISFSIATLACLRSPAQCNPDIEFPEEIVFSLASSQVSLARFVGIERVSAA